MRNSILVAGLLASLCPVMGLLVPEASARMDDLEPPTAYGRGADNLLALREPYICTHNVGLLTLQLTNVGLIGNPFIDAFGAGWRNAEYLYTSGLWIGAIGADADPHVSTANTYELRPDLDPLWTIYESFEGIEGGFRLGAAEPSAADDDGDGLVDEDVHDGFDNDGDGLVDEDYAAIGQQMFSCRYRDDTPEILSQDHTPLNVLVRQRSFQWSADQLSEFVGFEFEIINTGEQRLREMYLGFFSDSDVGPKDAEGYYRDDLVGWARIETTYVDRTASGACAIQGIRMDAAFMWDAPDDGISITGGDVPGVFGCLFLGHTTDDTGVRAPQSVGMTTVSWFSSSGRESPPQNDDERYQLLASETRPTRNATEPEDYQYLIAAGPFTQLDPGESLVFQTAYVIGDGHGGFRRNAVSAQRVFNGRYIDADGDPTTGVEGHERCLRVLEPGGEILWQDPCDTSGVPGDGRAIRWRSQECLYVDADCNPCTGIDGEETAVRWVGTTAPPSPGINTDPDLRIFNPDQTAFVSPDGDRKVILRWDNASEFTEDPFGVPDPVTGEIRRPFEGYQIWRVDDWQRPVGSVGPGPEDWTLIAEYRRNPRDGLGLASPVHLRRVTRSEVLPVGETESGLDIYPIGRYEYVDDEGVINGKVHFYAVTAFAIIQVYNPETDRMEEIELAGFPTAVEAQAVVPRWDAQPGAVDCDLVKVVPNPYRGSAEWDLVPSDRDPTGTKIALANLPEELVTVKIYTVSGDLVESAEHDGRGGNGTYFWNLITRNGQNAVSGVYVYSVEYSGGVCRGRFVVIR